MVFYVLNSSMVLYAKNTAVNTAHQQARSGIDEMLANIHASVSIPQLVSLQTVSGVKTWVPIAAPGTGPAQGVDFQKFDAGPFLLSTAVNVSASQTFVTITAPGWTPPASVTGLRFNIPSHKMELDVTSITGVGSTKIINFATPVGVNIITKADGSGNGNGNGNGTSNIAGFTTYRVTYGVDGTSPNYELRYYPTNDPTNYKAIARDVQSTPPGQAPLPFQILFNQNGGTDLRAVGAVNLSTAEPEYSNRGYAAVNMFVNSYIPFRSQLTVYQ
jgi:hypothetical protein